MGMTTATTTSPLGTVVGWHEKKGCHGACFKSFVQGLILLIKSEESEKVGGV